MKINKTLITNKVLNKEIFKENWNLHKSTDYPIYILDAFIQKFSMLIYNYLYKGNINIYTLNYPKNI